MNAFDEEMGPIAAYEEVERLVLLAEAGLTLDELRAFLRYTTENNTSTVN